jgi:hypothetical protein
MIRAKLSFGISRIIPEAVNIAHPAFIGFAQNAKDEVALAERKARKIVSTVALVTIVRNLLLSSAIPERG